MQILIAEDDPTSRLLLAATLERMGFDVVVAAGGTEAWEALQQEDCPQLAVLDWMMPGMDGVEVCRRVREDPALRHLYLIILTTRTSREDLVRGLDSGADDYLSKPFDRNELQARIRVGLRVVQLQGDLAERVRELEAALVQEKHLQGLLPICSYCKKIRDDGNYWKQVERYIEDHADVAFSHGICPDCYTTIVEPELEQLRARSDPSA